MTEALCAKNHTGRSSGSIDLSRQASIKLTDRHPPGLELCYLSIPTKQGTNSGLRRWSKKGRNKMQSLPPELELPEGDRFTLPTVSAVRELIPSGGQLPAHMVLMMICGKELWVPLDKEIARQMANILAPFRQ
jgi:hypothetical protein